MSIKVTAVQTTDDTFAFPEFSNPAENAKITKQRIDAGATRVWLRNNRLEIYREHRQEGIYRYFAVDKNTDPQLTLYCVRLDYANVKPLRVGCQVGVWVSHDSLITSGLSKDIFWKILFKHHDMITDSVQTSFGRRFWINRLTEAFHLGYYVYSLRYGTGKIKDAKHYPTLDSLEEDFSKLWGPKITDQARRLCITLKPLDLASHQKPYKAST
jgi:hypothetical protein